MKIFKAMKSFKVEKVLSGGGGSECRLGVWNLPMIPSKTSESAANDKSEMQSDSDASPEKMVYRTPMYLIHTQSGSIPHITPDVLQLIYHTGFTTSSSVNASPIPPLQVSLDSTIKFAESLKKFGKGVAKFVGLPEVATFLSVHDSLHLLRSGHNDKFGIALWSRHGRTSLTPELFVDALSSYKPSVCQILSDYDVIPGISGKKRLQKSLTRAKEYLDFVLKENLGTAQKSTSAHVPGLFYTIEATWFEMNEDLAKKTLATLLESQHRLEGVVIAGLIDRFAKPGPVLKDGEKKAEQIKVDVCQNVNLDLLEKILKMLPSELPKYVPGPFSLSQMLELLCKGVDILDSSLATKLADEAQAILLDQVEQILPSLSLSAGELSNVGNETLPERNGDKNASTEDETTRSTPCSVISIKDKRFFDDFRPVSAACPCYTCRKHTRSYVHHLYATDELLGPVLLQIHNLTALDRFFQVVRGVIHDSDSTEKLESKIATLKRLLTLPQTASDETSDTREGQTTAEMINGATMKGT